MSKNSQPCTPWKLQGFIPWIVSSPSWVRAHLGTEEEVEVVETDGVPDGDDGVGLADGGNGAEAVEEAVEVRLGQEEGAEIS